MSRYMLKPKDPKHEVVVGWDNPLNTYFIQVYVPEGTPEGDDDFLLWSGDRPGQVTDVGVLRSVAGVFAEWPEELSEMLQKQQLGLADANVVGNYFENA